MTLSKKIAYVVLVLVAGFVMLEVLRLLMLVRSIETYSQYWRRQATRASADNSLLYVALGDSTAQGIGASKPQNGYVGLITKALASQTNLPIHTVNLSVSGAKLQDVIDKQLPQLQEMNLPNGTVVTVAIGSNDLSQFDHVKFASEAEDLLSQLPPQTIVSDLPYFGGGRAKQREVAALDASEIMTGLAAKYKLRMAPVHQTTKDNDSIRDYGADFFHPSDRGYQNWYKAFVLGLKL